jgi:hypothetical protein
VNKHQNSARAAHFLSTPQVRDFRNWQQIFTDGKQLAAAFKEESGTPYIDLWVAE